MAHKTKLVRVTVMMPEELKTRLSTYLDSDKAREAGDIEMSAVIRESLHNYLNRKGA